MLKRQNLKQSKCIVNIYYRREKERKNIEKPKNLQIYTKS